MDSTLSTDVVVFGGGCAGLWLLDELRRRGLRVLLLEAGALGGTQTVASQGILHGGTKYALQGMFSASANAVSQMPTRWRESLSGAAEPDLSGVRLRATHCYLWRGDSMLSRLGMLGAQTFLTIKPVPVSAAERPALLANCPGQVFRLDEVVIDTASFAAVLVERNRNHILQIASDGLSFEFGLGGNAVSVTIRHPDSGATIRVLADQVVLAAGAGNERLRESLKLPAHAMQRRPLHMVLARGDLPLFNGHCVDGAKTRVTITSDRDSAGRTVWQVGGQIAEDGVRMSPEELIQHACQEISAVLPGWNPAGIDWTTYRIDRSEAKTASGVRPDDVQLLHERNLLTIWPTKLVLAPRMTDRVLESLGEVRPTGQARFVDEVNALQWPVPPLAKLPWELEATWTSGG